MSKHLSEAIATLKFYADDYNWGSFRPLADDTEIMIDGGRRAKEVLYLIEGDLLENKYEPNSVMRNTVTVQEALNILESDLSKYNFNRNDVFDGINLINKYSDNKAEIQSGYKKFW